MAITRGTTPLIAFTLPIEITKDQIKEAFLSVSQEKRLVVDKRLGANELAVDDVTATIAGKLKQVDTLLLTADKIAEVQIRFVDINDEAYATEIKTYNVYDILHEGVIG